MASSDLTANHWLSVLTASSKKAPEVVPPGWKTVAEIAKETHRAESYTRRLVREAVKVGALEERKFLIDSGSKLYPTPHFRIIRKK